MESFSLEVQRMQIFNTTYYDNYVFDNIEEQFNGITTEFSLKYEEDDIIGIHARNAIITIDSIVQQPDLDLEQ